MVTCEAMTPGDIKAAGRGVTLSYGGASTPFGDALIGWTTRGVCHLSFTDNADFECLDGLIDQWPAARLVSDPSKAEKLARKIFYRDAQPATLPVLLRGSNFQIKVWEALLRVPPGQLLSYSQLAELAGAPKAQRAVGTAIAYNTIGFLIPCHRVIRQGGEVGSYRWGSARKLAMQAWETGSYPND